jgi:hypothetical protein
VDDALSQIEEEKCLEKYPMNNHYRIFNVVINIRSKSVVDVKMVEDIEQL